MRAAAHLDTDSGTFSAAAHRLSFTWLSGGLVSAQAQPPWWHPLLWLHHRHVEKQLAAAQAGAAALGTELHVDKIREALAYQKCLYPRTALKVFACASAFFMFTAGVYQGACTKGGMLKPAPADDCSLAHDAWTNAFFLIGMVLLFLALSWVAEAIRGETIARCSKPLYPLLSMVVSSAAVAGPGTPYLESIKLSQEVSRIAVPLQALARDAAADFGNRRALRSELIKHLNRANATFAKTANQLTIDRESAAKRLCELAACTANSIAAGRFAAVMPETMLAQDASIEPDRLDGRRLGVAVLGASAVVTAFCLALVPLGASVGTLLLVAPVVFPVTVYTLLAFFHGLSEATRLTRSIGGFFPASPPV